MTIRWGVSPIAWANDDMPELGGDTRFKILTASGARRAGAGRGQPKGKRR